MPRVDKKILFLKVDHALKFEQRIALKELVSEALEKNELKDFVTIILENGIEPAVFDGALVEAIKQNTEAVAKQSEAIGQLVSLLAEEVLEGVEVDGPKTLDEPEKTL